MARKTLQTGRARPNRPTGQRDLSSHARAGGRMAGFGPAARSRAASRARRSGASAGSPRETERDAAAKLALHAGQPRAARGASRPRQSRLSLGRGQPPQRSDVPRTGGRNVDRATRRARPAAASRSRSASNVNKSAFVRSLPSTLSAAEVIEKGKAKGIKLSAAQVYTIRANARRKSPATDGVRSAAGRDSGKSRGRPNSREAEFIAAALDLGLARAEQLIRALRAKASSGWS